MLILSVTGIMLVNHGEWAWLWTGGLPLDEKIASNDDKKMWRHMQIDPTNSDVRITSGSAGAWLTTNAGTDWSRLSFGDEPWKNVQSLVAAYFDDTWTILAGTNDGLWETTLQHKQFRAVGLQGKTVNSIAVNDAKIIVALEMSTLQSGVRTGDTFDWKPLTMSPMPVEEHPTKLDLGRYLQDLHVGRGLFGNKFDSYLLNVTGIGLLILSVTGFAHWLILRYNNTLRRKLGANSRTSLKLTRMVKLLRWCYRTHAMLVGIVLIPLLMLQFLTGIYQDHRGALMPSFRSISIPTLLQTPSYRKEGWTGQVNNVAFGKDQNGEFLAIGNRRGVFISRDNAASWQAETQFTGPAMRVRQVGDGMLVPGRMVRRVQARNDGQWATLDVPAPVVMINEVSEGPDDTLWWTRGENIFITSLTGEMRQRVANNQPKLGYVPWGMLAVELHRGTLLSSQWKWINDIFACLGVALLISGFMRWRKRRW